jgi:cation diffusion facilitator family transporter
VSSDGSVSVIMTALAANAGIAIAKFFGAFFSGSAVLMAEAIHSLVDCANQGLLLFGTRRGKRPPTSRHPLGYGRESYFWSFIVAVLLFSLGGLFAIYEGIGKVAYPAPLGSPWMGISIMVLGIFLEGYALHSCLRAIRKENEYGSIWKWYRQTTSADLLVIFTEDTAAIAGLIIACISLLASWYTSNPIFDAVGSIVIGFLLVGVAIFLAVEIKSLIIGEAPKKDYRSGIEQVLVSTIPGSQLLKFISIQTGPNEVLVIYKITPGSLSSVKELIDGINKLENDVRSKFPEIIWQFVEPDYT